MWESRQHATAGDICRGRKPDRHRSGQACAGATTQTANRWAGVDQWQQLRDVVAVRARQDDRERHAVGVGGDVMFGTGSRTIGAVRSSFLPAPTARTEVESMTTREKSIRSAARSFASRISWSRSQTPACCQSLRRRQQLMPDRTPSRQVVRSSECRS